MRTIFLYLIASSWMAAPALGQSIETARSGFSVTSGPGAPPVALRVSAEGDTAVGQMVVTGTVAAFVGIVAGAYVGYRIHKPDCEDGALLCGVDGAIIGAAVGSTVLIPAGVHLVSQYSHFVAKLGASALVAGGTALTLAPTRGWSAALMPVAQVAATTWLEKRAARRRGASWAQ